MLVASVRREVCVACEGQRQAAGVGPLRSFDSYLRANARRIPNYGGRRRVGEAISTAFTEPTVNQVTSKRMTKNTTCAGPHAARTYSCRSVSESSTINLT